MLATILSQLSSPQLYKIPFSKPKPNLDSNSNSNSSLMCISIIEHYKYLGYLSTWPGPRTERGGYLRVLRATGDPTGDPSPQ